MFDDHTGEIQISQVGGSVAVASVGSLMEELLGHALIHWHTASPQISDTQVGFCGGQTAGCRKLIPMHRTCRVRRDTDACLIEESNFLFGPGIACFRSFLEPVRRQLLILANTVPAQ